MGDFNQYLWVEKNSGDIKGPILEIGAKHYDSKTKINYRELFPNEEYYGIDFQTGINVDFKIDITWDLKKIIDPLPKTHFNCIICNSVLEHVDNIFVAAKNITELLSHNGILLISVPFVWEEHGYPNDYWRFTPNGIKYLFPQLVFADEKSTVSSDISNDMDNIYKETSGVNNFIFKENIYHRHSSVSNPIRRKFLRLREIFIDKDFRMEYFIRVFFKRKNQLKKSCINMVAIKN